MATILGVMLQIRGYGVLLTGKSGVGKSLAAYTLLTQGIAQLIADDIVQLDTTPSGLMASAPPELFDRLEVRGLGIIQPSAHFGWHAVQRCYSLDLVIELLPAKISEDFQAQRISPSIKAWYYGNHSKPILPLILITPGSVGTIVDAAVRHWHIRNIQGSLCTS
jgi:HPr kinase/phosphorylase